MKEQRLKKQESRTKTRRRIAESEEESGERGKGAERSAILNFQLSLINSFSINPFFIKKKSQEQDIPSFLLALNFFKLLLLLVAGNGDVVYFPGGGLVSSCSTFVNPSDTDASVV